MVFLGRLEWVAWRGICVDTDVFRVLAFTFREPFRDALADSGEGGHLVKDGLFGVAGSLSSSEKQTPLSFKELLMPCCKNGCLWNIHGELSRVALSIVLSLK